MTDYFIDKIIPMDDIFLQDDYNISVKSENNYLFNIYMDGINDKDLIVIKSNFKEAIDYAKKMAEDIRAFYRGIYFTKINEVFSNDISVIEIIGYNPNFLLNRCQLVERIIIEKIE